MIAKKLKIKKISSLSSKNKCKILARKTNGRYKK